VPVTCIAGMRWSWREGGGGTVLLRMGKHCFALAAQRHLHTGGRRGRRPRGRGEMSRRSVGWEVRTVLAVGAPTRCALAVERHLRTGGRREGKFEQAQCGEGGKGLVETTLCWVEMELGWKGRTCGTLAAQRHLRTWGRRGGRLRAQYGVEVQKGACSVEAPTGSARKRQGAATATNPRRHC
jgi:hypothetical protein